MALKRKVSFGKVTGEALRKCEELWGVKSGEEYEVVCGPRWSNGEFVVKVKVGREIKTLPELFLV